MMRSQLISILGTALGLVLVPACSPLLRQPPDLAGSPTVGQQESVQGSQAGKMSDPPRQPGVAPSEITPAVGSEILVDKVRYPAMTSGADLIPEPRKPDKASVSVKQAEPAEHEPASEPSPDAKVRPPQDPPLVQAVRCFLDNRPAEAIGFLERYDKQSQDLLLAFLPLAVRVTEKDWQRHDLREVNNLLDQLDRLTTPLHRRAPLRIKEMRFCKDVEGFGKYRPLPENYGFKPLEMVNLYIELQNLVDERQDKGYSFHLLTNIEIRDFNNDLCWRNTFHDPGPNLSFSERHDFYHLCTFHIGDNKHRIAPGLYTLYVRITDVATGREADRTLDFRVVSAYGQNGW
jgi:hypothetical protein